MSEDSSEGRRSVSLAAALVIILVVAVATLFFMRKTDQKAAESRLESGRKQAELQQTILRGEIADLKNAAAEREAEFATQAGELRQREMAIAGRENAATERTQSSFQGLLIQQQIMKNLEALKASLPDMTPEVERLAKEHAQMSAERERLQEEITELRLRLHSSKPLEGR